MSGEPARVVVANQIKADNEGMDVKPYGYVPANVKGAAVVSVWRTDLTPATTSLNLVHDLTVNVYGSKTAGEAVEEEMDGLLDLVMKSLQRLTSFTFRSASRTVWTGNVSGWQITGQMESPNIYSSAVRAESS
jgi:hypothetical protein